MPDADPKAPKDRHPELSAPILNLGLEARIARAEQAVIDRDARMRGDARRIGDTLRFQRGAALKWAAIAGAGAAAGAMGYAGYRLWSGRSFAPVDRPRHAEPSKAASFTAEMAAIARVAARWAWTLHREQGIGGSLFAMVRSALWPSPGAAPAPPPAPGAPAASPNATGAFDVRH